MSPAPGRRHVILVAGPSGSGKSRLSAATGVPQLRLDDFYFDDDHPDLPHTLGIIDWDHPDSWNCQAAVTTLVHLTRYGHADVPVYEISQNRTVGTRHFDIAGSPALLCEGIFAPYLLGPCRDAGLEPVAIWLDRPRGLNFVRRLTRDLKEHRKPPLVLLRRGWQLLLREPAMRKVAVSAGFTPQGMRAAHRLVTELSAS